MICQRCELRAAVVYLLHGPVSENVIIDLCDDCAAGCEGERCRNPVDAFLAAMEQVRNVQLREPTVADVKRIVNWYKPRLSNRFVAVANQPLERTVAAIYFIGGRASRVRRHGRSTASRYVPMALTPEQSSRVKYLLDGGWGRTDLAESDEEPAYWTDFDRVLAEVNTPEELHEFVDRWNWDGGTEPIRRALAHPLCDRGTALMVYWRIDPIFYLKPEHDTRAKVEANLWPDAVVHWDMLREIEQRLAVNQFRTAQVAFDPTNDPGRDRTKQRFKKKPPIPLFENIDGKLVKVGEKQRPEDPEIDVRGSLPAVVFEPVKGGGSAGT